MDFVRYALLFVAVVSVLFLCSELGEIWKCYNRNELYEPTRETQVTRWCAIAYLVTYIVSLF